MENKKEIQLSSGRRTMIFLCLVVSGIASSILSTAMTTAPAQCSGIFWDQYVDRTVDHQRVLSGNGNDHASDCISHNKVSYEKAVSEHAI